jgi:hypothetical protein
MVTLRQLRDRPLIIDKAPKSQRRILPPFWVTTFIDEGTWKYVVEPGYVTFQNIGHADVVGYLTPTLGGTSLEADTRPEGTLPGNDCYVYVRVITDAKGVISGTPTIVSSTSESTSVHHEPPDESDASGSGGEYYFLIAEFEEFTPSIGDASPTAVRRITGNKHIPNQLVEFENLGSGKKIHRDYVPDADDKHELRSIIQRASQPQIHVKYDNEDAAGDEIDAEEILIEGNDYDNSGGGFATVQNVSDGLVTSFTDFSFGHDGNVVVPDPCGLGYYTLVFEKGNLRSAAFTTL